MSAKLAIAADHAGYELKKFLKDRYKNNLEWIDLGTYSEDSVDYPDYGIAMARAIEDGPAEKGVIICGSGIGISIAANRFRHIRAALCTSVTEARLSRLHNDANVLAMGARIIGRQTACDCLEAFLENSFEGGRHDARVKKLSNAV